MDDGERKKKYKVIRKKLEILAQEAGEVVFDEEVLEKMEDKIREDLKSENIPYRRESLRAFYRGLEMMLHTPDNLKMMVSVATSVLIKRMNERLASEMAKSSLELPKKDDKK